jgi:cell division protein FtsW (lipid II flippase)
MDTSSMTSQSNDLKENEKITTFPRFTKTIAMNCMLLLFVGLGMFSHLSVSDPSLNFSITARLFLNVGFALLVAVPLLTIIALFLKTQTVLNKISYTINLIFLVYTCLFASYGLINNGIQYAWVFIFYSPFLFNIIILKKQRSIVERIRNEVTYKESLSP